MRPRSQATQYNEDAVVCRHHPRQAMANSAPLGNGRRFCCPWSSGYQPLPSSYFSPHFHLRTPGFSRLFHRREGTLSTMVADEMYIRLKEIHRDACASGRYQVSYYLLSAMLHLASEMGDKARLLEISREASERRAWLEVHEPTHPLATRPGYPGAFEVLASIALARVQ